MNRLKVLVYVLLVVAAGAAGVWGAARELAALAVREADGDLAGAAAQLAEAQRRLATEAAAVAGLAARDPALRERLAVEGPAAPAGARHKGRPAPTQPAESADEQRSGIERAARGAIEAAEVALGVDLPDGTFWKVAARDLIEQEIARAAAAKSGPQREVAEILRDAAGGKARRGYARVDGGLWVGVGVPAGDGGALALFVPLDVRWARDLRRATGVDVALSAGLEKPVATALAADLKSAVDAAVKTPAVPVGVGVVPRVDITYGTGVSLFKAPLLLVKAPAWRVQAVPLPGLAKAYAVLAVPMTPRLAGLVTGQWWAVAALAVVLLFGLVTVIVVRGELPPQIPEALVVAAGRIERGEFGARAPTLAGKFGVIANALNRAVEAAARSGTGAPSPTEEFFQAAAKAAPAPSTADPFELPRSRAAEAPAAFGPVLDAAPADATAAATTTTSRLDGAGLFGGTFEAAPVPRAAPEPAPAPAAIAKSPPAPAPAPAARAPDLLQSAARAAPAAELTDEEHWQQVFDEFLRVRTQCGESSEGLTFDRFRVKLEKNKDQLVQKYGCRTVRFQVYVKEGKTALKATPVR
jgi:hypothetical protein